MRVQVNNSTDIFTFSLYNDSLGQDLIFDFMETHCAFVAEQFIYLEEENVYLCEQETYNKWQYIISQQNKLSALISNLKIDHGEFQVNEVINKALFHGIEDEADAINYELDKVFGDFVR